MSTPPIDSRADINPNLLGQYVYEYIGPYFKQKYGLQYVEQYPKERVTTPSITWRVYKRVPGGGKHGVAQARGASFSRTNSTDEYGNVIEDHKQQHQIVMEYAIFGTSSDEVDNIAWDLENAIVDCEGILQRKIEGFGLSFDQMLGDSNLSWRDQDDLNVRTLRFTFLVPVRYRVVIPQLKEIILQTNVGLYRNITTPQTRTASEYFEITDVERVMEIASVLKQKAGSSTVYPLYQGFDYQVVRNAETGNVKIKWLDQQGAPPDIGDLFVVEYLYSATASTTSQRAPSLALPSVLFEDGLGNVIAEK
jgi:hypothetical protein